MDLSTSISVPPTVSSGLAFVMTPSQEPALIRDTAHLKRKLSIQSPRGLEAKSSSSPTIHQDENGRCIFGQKSYWDSMYSGDSTADRPSDSYSWYCGWDELAPFWTHLVPNKRDPVLIAGIGNDPAPVGMFDAGWTNMTAFDYSKEGVQRARELFGPERDGVMLITADARDLPLPNASIDATLDKGTLDAIYITGKDVFLDSVRELGRVTAEGGVVMCISRVIWPDDLMKAFDTQLWENVHDGSLAFAPDGEATIDLGAELYSWRRTKEESAGT
mmetsp:Transcript_19642/g.39827  ORF Transcript_19642/g.39827 Transcript_19642/m.39827 type:complete len:274 (+) Transcript_19642:359-1180(+)